MFRPQSLPGAKRVGPVLGTGAGPDMPLRFLVAGLPQDGGYVCHEAAGCITRGLGETRVILENELARADVNRLAESLAHLGLTSLFILSKDWFDKLRSPGQEQTMAPRPCQQCDLDYYL